MSSTPLTPGSMYEEDTTPASSLPSSPPSATMSDDNDSDLKDEAVPIKDDEPQSQSQRNGEKDEKSMKDLDWFLNRSQGFSSTVMTQLKQALSARNTQTTAQPKLVSGGTMRDYQLEGLTWLTCLYQIGLNGILADEMGLGKTIQLISFLAFLREQGTYGPFLILGPLSTVENWVGEFRRWTPKIPVVMYHGTPQARAQIRKQKLKGAGGAAFPVVCTSYEICMRDRKFLAAHQWKFIVVDEGHRLKNFNCKLVRELKQYPSESRLILTGTPLQNNLSELWSLLNFLLPDAFADLEHFESLFDFSSVREKDGHKEFLTQERKTKTVASLHAILKPFLLRRVKADVETLLPKKREYILYAPLSAEQKAIYRKIKENELRPYLEEKALERITSEKKKEEEKSPRKRQQPKPSSLNQLKRKAPGNSDETGTRTSNKSAKSSASSTPAGGTRSGRRAAKNQTYREVSDREWFQKMAESSESEEIDEDEQEEQERANDRSQARKQVLQKKLQNPIMQLRLACNSPLHFEPPLPPSPSHTLLSGKMQLLSQLLPRLLPQHKTLIFSQFTRQLDLLEDWAEALHPEWGICRIDGSVAAAERAAQIHAFNTHPDHCLFLLSTRAGGLGINLTAADTVVLFDSDWNPQQDLQAQDRAHRIGQTRPVIVYRLATRGTVEQMLLERADGKRRLEKLVMQRDKFRGFSSSSSSSSAPKGNDAMAELRRLLAGDDFEKYDLKGEEGVLTAQDLHVLTDRSEDAFQRAAEMGTAEGADGGAAAGTGAGVGGEGRDDGKFKSVVGKKGAEGDVLAGLV